MHSVGLWHSVLYLSKCLLVSSYSAIRDGARGFKNLQSLEGAPAIHWESNSCASVADLLEESCQRSIFPWFWDDKVCHVCASNLWLADIPIVLLIHNKDRYHLGAMVCV